MRMRGWMLRVLRVVFFGVAAWGSYTLLAPSGRGWIVPVVAAALAALWIGWRFVIVRRRRAADAEADRWAGALLDAPRRAEAIVEIRASLDKLTRGTSEHARRSLVLAEMLEAHGDTSAARTALDEVAVEKLPERTVALVAHARAVVALSAGDAAAASEILDAVPGPCGDRAVDLRMRLLRGAVAAERGDVERALEVAEKARRDAGGDDDLKMEARVLKAVALDASGDHADAVRVMRALGDEMLEVLLVLGLPRVKKLAQAALDAE